MMMAETEEMEMTYQNIFRRYEIKYILTASQRLDLESEMKGKMGIDKYGRTTIRNIYFDTDDNRLIRTSLDKPEYKEKLRVRSYSRVSEDDDVFVELKKKYESVVYKRRIALPEFEAMDWLAAGGDRPLDTQICKEIDYVRTFYRDLAPKVFLSYEREAYYPVDGSDIRITMDSNIPGGTVPPVRPFLQDRQIQEFRDRRLRHRIIHGSSDSQSQRGQADSLREGS